MSPHKYLAFVVLTLLVALPLGAQPGDRAGHGPDGPPPTPVPIPAPDPGPHPDDSPPAAPIVCPDGPALVESEVESLLAGAAAALGSPALVVAVVDRAGRPLGVYRRPGANLDDEDLAVGLARTGAFFSNNQAPLSSRTVRFVSGIHFPPGIPNTPNAALYGIENTNRGCDLNVTWNPDSELPPASSVHGGICGAFDNTGCGTGPVTGKADASDSDPSAVNPGGVPVFRDGSLIGGIGVAGVGPRAAEGAAVAAILGSGLTPFPNPLPDPGVVFIDGIRLPFVKFLAPPDGTATGSFAAADITLGPFHGGCAPDGYLVGPKAGTFLSQADVERLVEQSRAVASRTRAVIRLPLGERARMAISVADVDGEILALFRMVDATVFSVDVAASKARNVIYFSDPTSGGHLDIPGMPAGTAITNRTINFGSQPLFPPGIDRLDEPAEQGPFFRLFLDDLANPCSQGSEPRHVNQSGVVFFPGSIPLYRDGQLIGGLGISGDGVEQDDYVSFLGADGFLPSEAIWADRVKIDRVRMPFLKFPRNPER